MIYANNLNVVTGANSVDHNTLNATPIADNGPAPGVSIDVGNLGGMYANRIVLFYLDDLTIGSRYTMRGFDGETMLAAEKAFYWRNELQWPIGQTGQALYAGVDCGRVWGSNTAVLAGTQLAGAVIGLRGSVPAKYASFAYDLFAGKPVYKPSAFPTARATLGLQATAQF